MSEGSPGSPVGDDVYLALQRFLHREAALLDRRDFHAWLGLLADDIVYRVLVRIIREGADGELDTAIIDDDAVTLRARVGQMANPRFTRAENPPSFTRRFVSNLEASHGERPGEFVVSTNLLIYRSKSTVPEGGVYAGGRTDILRGADGTLRLARREVRLDHAVLHGGVVSILF